MHEVYTDFFQRTLVSGAETLFQNDSEKKKKSNEMPEKSIFECDFYVKPLEKSADGNFYTPMTKSIPDFLREGNKHCHPYERFCAFEG